MMVVIKIIPFWEKRLNEIKNAPYNQVNDRVKRHTEQYIENGFDDSDTWSLDYHLASLILPRLKRFKELAGKVIVIDYPIDDIIEAFQIYVYKDSTQWSECDKKKIEIGLQAFADNFQRLWW